VNKQLVLTNVNDNSGLERPNEAAFAKERVQALKLVRAIVEASGGELPRSVTQSLVALAEASGEPLRRQALRTLCEVALRRPALLAAANGVRTLLHAIVEPSLEAEQPALIAALVFLLDGPSTRQYVRANDVAVVLAPLCSTYRGKDALSADELAVWRAVSIVFVCVACVRACVRAVIHHCCQQHCVCSRCERSC
jgi:hypothetical protein